MCVVSSVNQLSVINSMLKTINLIGAKISFDEINGHSSKTIVFVHGNSQSRSSFEHQLKDTAFCDYRLISLDLPGHGDSDSLSVYSIPIFSNYLSDFIQTMALDQYMLVGHSLGGHIVVETLNAISPAGILIAGASLVTKPIKAEAFHAHEMMPYLYQDDLSDEQILKLLSSFHQSKLPRLYKYRTHI